MFWLLFDGDTFVSKLTLLCTLGVLNLWARSTPWCHVIQPIKLPMDLWGALWTMAPCTRPGMQDGMGSNPTQVREVWGS